MASRTAMSLSFSTYFGGSASILGRLSFAATLSLTYLRSIQTIRKKDAVAAKRAPKKRRR